MHTQLNDSIAPIRGQRRLHCSDTDGGAGWRCIYHWR